MLKKIMIAAAVLVVLGLVLGRSYLTGNVALTENKFLYIPTGTTFAQLQKILADGKYLSDAESFNTLASKMGYTKAVKPGKYNITTGMSNYTLLRMLRSGNQKPVKLVLNKYRLESDLAGKIGRTLEADSNQLLQLLNDNIFLKQYGLDSNTSIAAFMPNTYEFYWNTSAQKVFEKVATAYKKYWTPEHIAQAKQQNLSPAEAVTLASIVDEETNNKKEKPMVASVYLNRLRKGIKLDADPTCKFAVGDFTIKRVLAKHTQYTSPYNTYLTAGLPPGPICTPSQSSIEAVLQPAKSEYIFFCAHPNMKQEHIFAISYAEHQANATRYQAALTAYLAQKKNNAKAP